MRRGPRRILLSADAKVAPLGAQNLTLLLPFSQSSLGVLRPRSCVLLSLLLPPLPLLAQRDDSSLPRVTSLGLRRHGEAATGRPAVRQSRRGASPLPGASRSLGGSTWRLCNPNADPTASSTTTIRHRPCWC